MLRNNNRIIKLTGNMIIIPVLQKTKFVNMTCFIIYFFSRFIISFSVYVLSFLFIFTIHMHTREVDKKPAIIASSP